MKLNASLPASLAAREPHGRRPARRFVAPPADQPARRAPPASSVTARRPTNPGSSRMVMDRALFSDPQVRPDVVRLRAACFNPEARFFTVLGRTRPRSPELPHGRLTAFSAGAFRCRHGSRH